jgi:hypothetical protein
MLHPVFFVARVIARHDFNAVVSQNAWSEERNARTWGEDAKAEALAEAMKADPSFAYGYDFALEIETHCIQDI